MTIWKYTLAPTVEPQTAETNPARDGGRTGGERNMKANCYDCKHSRTIPGDAHLSCAHPALGDIDGNPFGSLVQMLGGKFAEGAKKLEIQGDPHGIRRGWFCWPVNFDPVWLKNCNGFATKAEQERAK